MDRVGIINYMSCKRFFDKFLFLLNIKGNWSRNLSIGLDYLNVYLIRNLKGVYHFTARMKKNKLFRQKVNILPKYPK